MQLIMKKVTPDIDSYIDLQPEKVRPILKELRQTIINADPGAEELISYNMPALRFHGNMIWFGAFKNHYTIFLHRNILQNFREELKSYELSESESGIKIPLDKPVPVQLLTKIIKSVAKTDPQNLHK